MGRLWFFLYIFLGFLLCILVPTIGNQALAQTSPLELQNDIIGQEEQRRNEFMRGFQHQDPPQEAGQKSGQESEQYAALPPTHKDHSQKFLFHAIETKGVTQFQLFEIQRLIKPFLNRDITLSEIDELMRELTNKYIDKGFVATRVYLPPQNIMTGVLIIEVQEAQIEDVRLLENDHERQGFNTVFPEHGPFNLRDFEQGLDQINRLKSYDSKIDILPGSEPGLSQIKISSALKNETKTSYFMESHNGGSRATGKYQQSFGLSLDDFLGLYDQFSLSFRHDLGLNESGKKNRGGSFAASIPYDYWTFRWVSDYYSYLQTMRTGLQPIYIEGSNQSSMAEIERIIHRDGTSKTGIALALTLKNAKNYINSLKILNNTRKLTLASGRIFHARRILGGALSLSSQYDRGLKWLGAKKDRITQSSQARAQFKRVKLDASYQRPFSLIGQKFSASFMGNAVWSSDSLLSSEKQSIGGHSTVRGFWDQSLSGNKGAFIRNELAWHLPESSSAALNKVIEGTQLFAAYDMGWIQKNSKNGSDYGQLRGITMGLKKEMGVFKGELSYEKALNKPTSFFKLDKRIYFRVKFDL